VVRCPHVVKRRMEMCRGNSLTRLDASKTAIGIGPSHQRGHGVCRCRAHCFAMYAAKSAASFRDKLIPCMADAVTQAEVM
jgi:hypothetical protein